MADGWAIAWPTLATTVVLEDSEEVTRQRGTTNVGAQEASIAPLNEGPAGKACVGASGEDERKFRSSPPAPSTFSNTPFESDWERFLQPFLK
jgi:hypothetical protein